MDGLKTLFAVVGALLVIGAMVGPVAAADNGDTLDEVDDAESEDVDDHEDTEQADELENDVENDSDDSDADEGAESDGLTVSIEQDNDGNATILVTKNDVSVMNASVEVESANETYANDGEYTTDEDGMVALPAPNETVQVTVIVIHADEIETVTGTLVSANDMADDESSANDVGHQVSAFVQALHNDDVQRIGPLVASFALEHNPGNAPDHAGPPAWVTNEDHEPGPPAHAGPKDDKRGPPAHAGSNADKGVYGDEDDDDEDEDASSSEDDGAEDGELSDNNNESEDA